MNKEEVSRNVEDTIEKRLKGKDEEKARRDRMMNITVHGITEAKGTTKNKDIQKT